jgi:hypothetical protein
MGICGICITHFFEFYPEKEFGYVFFTNCNIGDKIKNLLNHDFEL